MTAAVALLAGRIVLIILMYLFLFTVVRVLMQDMKTAVKSVPTFSGPGARAGIPDELQRIALEVMEPGQTPLYAGQRFNIQDPVLLGRSAGNDITLEDDWISSQHVRLRRQNGKWLIEDLGSTNGTWVNGTPLHGVARMKVGDVLKLGRVVFKVVVGL